MVIERKAKKGQEIFNGNQVLKLINDPLMLELPDGDQVKFTIASRPSPSTNTPLKRKAKVGQAVMLNGRALLTFGQVGRVLIRIPGDDIEFDVQPADAGGGGDQPPQSVDLLVKAGEDLKQRLAGIRAGTAAKPFLVGLERGGQWDETITVNKSNVHFGATGNGARRPRVKANTGVEFENNVGNVRFSGIDFEGNGNKGHGVDLIANGVSNVTFEDCLFQNFSGGLTAHRDPLDMLKPPVISNLALRRCRFLDMMDDDPKEGHGVFAAQVDGLTVEECFIHKAGWNKKHRTGAQKFDIFTHGIYDQAGNKRCVYRRNVLVCCESVGIQARGPLVKPTDAHDGSASPQLVNNVMIDCAIGMIVNGPRATVTGNLVVPGHYHSTQKTGQGGMMCHVGAGKVANNVRLGGGKAPAGGQVKMKAWDVSKRQPQDKAWWWWNKALTTDVENNLDKPQAKVDDAKLDALIQEGRNGPASMSDWVTRVRKLLLDTAGIADDFPG